MTNETARWALYKQYDEVNENFRTVWKLYLTFYTANLTINVAALAFVRGFVGSPRPAGAVAFAFVAIDLLIAASSVALGLFTLRSVGKFNLVAKDLTNFARTEGEALDPEVCFRRTLPRDLCLWAAGANIVGMVLVAAVWLAMLYHGGG